MLVHIVADYGAGDLAFAEVVQQIKRRLPDAEPVLTPVPPFATLAAGFCIAQLGLNPSPPSTLIYHNVAPRQDDDDPRAENRGERLSFARLPTGVRVIGVNSGHVLSFLRDEALELRWANSSSTGSQFRSRDVFPDAAVAIAQDQPDALAEQLPAGEIPRIPCDRVAYVDGYGNLKTSIEAGSVTIRAGSRVRVQVGGAEQEGVVSDASFGVRPGQLAFAPGSSGWPRGAGGETRWMELFLRGGSAWEALGHPESGARVHVAEL